MLCWIQYYENIHAVTASEENKGLQMESPVFIIPIQSATGVEQKYQACEMSPFRLNSVARSLPGDNQGRIYSEFAHFAHSLLRALDGIFERENVRIYCSTRWYHLKALFKGSIKTA